MSNNSESRSQHTGIASLAGRSLAGHPISERPQAFEVVLSTQEYVRALKEVEPSMGAIARAMFVAHVESLGLTLTVSQLARASGRDNPQIVYSRYGSFAHLLVNALGCEESWDADWTFVLGHCFRNHAGEVTWQLHPEIAAAANQLGWAQPSEETLVEACLPSPEVEVERTGTRIERVGQALFRSALDSAFGTCAVTGCGVREALRASHIIPWRDATRSQKRDPDNGLLLAAHLDVLFDKGLVTFDDDGSIRFSSQLSETDRLALGLRCDMRARLSGGRRAYMEVHRSLYFRE